MKIPLLFLLAILTPVLLTATILVPPYAGIFGAVYIIYDTGAHPHPLANRIDDVSYIVFNVFPQLISYWTAHMKDVGFLKFTLPLIGLPLVGLYLAYWLTRRVLRMLSNAFHMAASH